MVYASIKCKLYLVKGLRANILIGNNILALKGFVFNVRLGHVVVGSCGIKITIKARQRGQFLRRRLFAEKNKVIPPPFEVMISLLPVPLPNNRDFLFHLIAHTNLTLFAHIIHHDTTKILVWNTSDRPLRISYCQRLGHVVDIRYDNYYPANAKFAFNSTTVPPLIALFFKHKPSCTPIPTNPSMETTLDNGVKIFGDQHTVTLLA